MIRLTDKEMQGIMGDCLDDLSECSDCTGSCDKIAKSQVKKFVEWGKEDCPHTMKSHMKFKHECPKCWLVLLEEI